MFGCSSHIFVSKSWINLREILHQFEIKFNRKFFRFPWKSPCVTEGYSFSDSGTLSSIDVLSFHILFPLFLNMHDSFYSTLKSSISICMRLIFFFNLVSCWSLFQLLEHKLCAVGYFLTHFFHWIKVLKWKVWSKSCQKIYNLKRN